MTNLHSGLYIVAGNSRKTLDVGVVQAATETGYWVWWMWSCKATIYTGDPTATLHESIEDAEDEADMRWVRLKPQVRVSR